MDISTRIDHGDDDRVDVSCFSVRNVPEACDVRNIGLIMQNDIEIWLGQMTTGFAQPDIHDLRCPDMADTTGYILRSKIHGMMSLFSLLADSLPIEMDSLPFRRMVAKGP